MDLSDDDKALIRDHLDRGEPLPERFRWLLFAEPREAELIWPGKTGEVTNVVLPFQSIEQIDEPRAESGAQVADLFQMGAGGRQGGGWSNKLIWGDNKLVLASLKGGPLRREIETAGGLKLVYIDPPFDIGADFSVELEIGGENLAKSSTVIEEIAYRDTWGRGESSYLAMIGERLAIIRQLLADDGSIYVHIGPNISHHVKILMDEIFGKERYLNEIIWQRHGAHNDAGKFGIVHDTILYYSKSDKWKFSPQYAAYDQEYIDERFSYIEEGSGRRFWPNTLTGAGGGPALLIGGQRLAPPRGRHWAYEQVGMAELERKNRIYFSSSGKPYLKQYLDESPGKPAQSIWPDVRMTRSGYERVYYATQKPESLLNRIILASSGEGDLVVRPQQKNPL